MSDPTAGGSPAGGFLEGLLEGGAGGYGFRDQINARRRATKLQSDLLTLRQQEAARQQSAADREQTTFDEQQEAYRTAKALRDEIANRLAIPAKQTLGEYLQGRPGSVHVGAAPLSKEAMTAQAVGRTLGEFGGRNLNPDESLLVGSGEVPYSAIQPRTYHPRSRQEWLDNLRVAAGIRGQGSRLPITMDHAFAVLDRLYTHQDPKTGNWVNPLKPGDRYRLAQSMVNGTLKPDDLPDLEEQPAAPAPAAQPDTTTGPVGRALEGGWNFLRGMMGRGGVGARGVSGTPGAVGAPAGDQNEQLRELINQYRDLPHDQLESALRDAGYDDETIRAAIGSPN